MSHLVRAGIVLALAVNVVSVDAAGTWLYAVSDHFEAYTTVDERRARDVLRDFEQVRAFFQSGVLPVPATRTATRLLVFSSAKEYAPFRPNEVFEAFYQAGPDRDVIVMQSGESDARPVVIHEYAHLLFWRTGAAYPLWLNEGLADFYSTMTPEGSRMRLGLPPERRLPPLNGRLPLIALDRLFSIDHNAAEYTMPSQAALFYSECWALAHMLLIDPRYRPNAPAFLAMLSTGTSAADGIRSVFGKSVSAIQADLSVYVRRSQYSSVLMEYAAPRATVQVTTRPASALEAGVVTAAVLGRMDGREGAARLAFEQLEKQYPDDLSLLESRGLFEFDRGLPMDALPYFERAADLGSRHARLFRSYASLVATDDKRAEGLLAKAMNLDSADVETRVMLARLLVRQRRPEEAIQTLSISTAIPANVAFYFHETLAHAAMLASRGDLANTAIANAEQAARSSEQIRAASALRIRVDPSATTSLVERAASGRLTNVVCASGPSIIEVTTPVTTLRLLIDEPRAVTIDGHAGETIDLPCGPQNRPIRVGFLPRDDAGRQTHGLLRFLSFERESPAG